MLLVVGLGNPGIEYKNTRHNIGFQFLHALADRYHAKFLLKGKFKSQLAHFILGDRHILLACPETYMNLSGEAMLAISNFYKIDISQIIVIHDDVDLKLKKVKAQIGGSARGHNGLKSIDRIIGNQYLRLRIGVGRPDTIQQLSDYVLACFSKDEEIAIDKIKQQFVANFASIAKQDINEMQIIFN